MNIVQNELHQKSCLLSRTCQLWGRIEFTVNVLDNYIIVQPKSTLIRHTLKPSLANTLSFDMCILNKALLGYITYASNNQAVQK